MMEGRVYYRLLLHHLVQQKLDAIPDTCRILEPGVPVKMQLIPIISLIVESFGCCRV